MIFKNKTAFTINRYTNHKTNTKSYNILTDNFIFEATFKLTSKKLKSKEYCVLAREGYNMGIFIQEFDGENYVKWVWWETNEKNEEIYNDIFVHTKLNLSTFNTVKVIKKDNQFIMYVNNELYETRTLIHKLYDYKDKYIFIGAANPFCKNNNQCWFYGNIKDVKIYHSSDEIIDNLYLWFDFEKTSNFKTFDKSGNGNHGEKYETMEEKRRQSEEFNKLGRPAKIK